MRVENPGFVTDRTWAKHLATARGYAATLTPGQAAVMLALAHDAVKHPSTPNQRGGCNGEKQRSVDHANVVALSDRVAQQ